MKKIFFEKKKNKTVSNSEIIGMITRKDWEGKVDG